MAEREPIFNVPAIVVLILAVFIGVHVWLVNLSDEDLTWWVWTLAFVPARYSGYASAIPGGEPATVTSLITHMLVHIDRVHLLINSAWFLAFGSVLAKRMGTPRFLAFSVAGGIAGALLFLAFNWNLPSPVVGASGAISAMMGAVMRFLFIAIDARQGYLLREHPAAIPLLPLNAVIRDRRIVIASAIFIAINLLAVIGFGSFGAVGSIAWEAHLGGYLFGIAAFGLFDVATQNSEPNFADSN